MLWVCDCCLYRVLAMTSCDRVQVTLWEPERRETEKRETERRETERRETLPGQEKRETEKREMFHC